MRLAQPVDLRVIVGAADHTLGWHVDRTEDHFSEDGYDPFC